MRRLSHQVSALMMIPLRATHKDEMSYLMHAWKCLVKTEDSRHERLAFLASCFDFISLIGSIDYKLCD